MLQCHVDDVDSLRLGDKNVSEEILDLFINCNMAEIDFIECLTWLDTSMLKLARDTAVI